MITTVLAFLLTLGLLIVIHEYGHYRVAVACGVKVLRFSVGFGRPLWMRRGRDGCEFAVSALPLGGYVKMLDEREGPVPAHERSRAFNNRPLLQRTAIVLAGPGGNLVLVAANAGTAGRPGWNLPLLVVSAIAAAALGDGIAWPQARELLGFAVPSWPGMLAGAGVACGAVLLSAWLLSRRSPTEAD